MKLSAVKKSLICIIAGISLAFVIKVFAADILHISGKSMEPAVKDGSSVFVYRLSYGLCKPFGDHLVIQWKTPCIGDVVVYLHDNNMVIKRCAATEGMTLEYSSNPYYTLTVDGRSYSLTQEQYLLMKPCTTVPEGTILAIGDNTAVSIDSRNYGFVRVENVLGKVVCR